MRRTVLDPPEFFRHACAAFLALGVCFAAYGASCRLLPDEASWIRLSATWIATVAVQVALFLLLSAAGQFAYRPLASSVVALTALACWRPADVVILARRDVAAALGAWRALGWWRVVAIAVSLPSALRLVRALVSPPLAWDALTYHLPRAVEWVQHQRFTPLPGPDAATYYSYFPPFGDVVLAWALAATGSDAWLFAVGAWSWIGVAGGAYALARTLGAPTSAAGAAAFAGASLPAVSGYVSANYVDNLALATLLGALTFALRLAANWSRTDALACGLALGLLLGTKSSGLPLVAIVAGWIAIGAAKARTSKAARSCALAALAAVAIAAPPFVTAAIDTGNPLYPIDLSLGAFVRLPGHPQLTAMMESGQIDWTAVRDSVFGWRPAAPAFDVLGLGPGALLLPVLAILGMRRVTHVPRASVALLLLVALSAVASTFAPSARALWAFWAPVTARFAAPAACVLIAFAALARWPGVLWGIAGVSAFVALPRGIGAVEWRGLAEAAPIVAAAVALLLVAWRLAATGRLWPALSIACVTIIATTTGAAPIRDRLRTPAYEAAARGDAFDLHGLARGEAGAWPLWQQLEHRPGLRLALSAGFTGPGHNWYRYPLYGVRLQHAVVYIPVTADGGLVSYQRPEELRAVTCQPCWADRLRTEKVAVLAVIPPLSIEAEWARSMGDAFAEVPGLGSAAVFVVQPSPPR